MNTYIHSTISVDGWHRWQNAPKPRQEYLSVRHRHTFKITATVEVHHDDRAVECFDLADALRQLVEAMWKPTAPDNLADFGDYSCEQIAKRLFCCLALSYEKICCVTVLEDGLNGASIDVR
tara:strand:+ start:1511 stop:1873 length:363 start_codon:yes stop_codon:yes gene_type:complete